MVTRQMDRTTGTALRPGHQFSGAVLKFDLAGELEQLRREMHERGERRYSKTLIKEADFSVLLVAMSQGAEIRQHAMSGEVGLQMVHGSAVLTAVERFGLTAGNIVVLNRGAAFSLVATEDAGVLFTVARNTVLDLATPKGVQP
jgi:quercetin dioxygenase-like cupin family protein